MITLRHLFLAGEPLPCVDAADADDGGGLDLTDAIRILRFLFLGGDPLPAPREGCGPDPSEDPLGCRSYPPCA